MKPIVEKLTPGQNNSFLTCTYTTPEFEVPWHQHIEYELILFKQGEGRSFIGNYVGEFKTGDIFFLGSNLPHTFQKAHSNLVTSALVVQFREDFWGNNFLMLPECNDLRDLFRLSYHGLKLNSNSKIIITPMLLELECAEGLERVILLCEILQHIIISNDFEKVSTQETSSINTKQKERIDKIVQYTIDYFQEPVNITDVAKYAGMSVPAFCKYFKKSTKKTYIDFLNEVRISHACKQLITTQNSVESICYESGFNTLANFNKRFFNIKKVTPSKFRKQFLSANS